MSTNLKEAVALAHVIRAVVVPVCMSALPAVFRKEADVYDLLLLPARRLAEFYKNDPDTQKRVVVDPSADLRTYNDLLSLLKLAATMRDGSQDAAAINDPTATSWKFRDLNVDLFDSLWIKIFRDLDVNGGSGPLIDVVDHKDRTNAVLGLLRQMMDRPATDTDKYPVAGFGQEATKDLKTLTERVKDLAQNAIDDRAFGPDVYDTTPEAMECQDLIREIAQVTFVPLLLPVVPAIITYAQTWFISPDVDLVGIDPVTKKGRADAKAMAAAGESGVAQTRVWHVFIERVNQMAGDHVWKYVSTVLNDYLANWNAAGGTVQSTFATKVVALLWVREWTRALSDQFPFSPQGTGFNPTAFMTNPSTYLKGMAASVPKGGSLSAQQIQTFAKETGIDTQFNMNADAYLREVMVVLKKFETDVVPVATKQLRALWTM